MTREIIDIGHGVIALTNHAPEQFTYFINFFLAVGPVTYPDTGHVLTPAQAIEISIPRDAALALASALVHVCGTPAKGR